MAKVIRDLADTSSYWAAVWAMCAMPDVHVICDAPIGCFNLVATAVPDYTDSIPHIENITPSVIRDEEVGGAGTGEAVKRTYEGLRDEGMIDGKTLIVVSTAESEMIGSDLTDLVTQLGEGTTFFHSESLSDDEHVGRDRVLQWLWENYGAAAAQNIEVEQGLVNIIGPTLGNFNSPSDLHEVKRLIEGAGGRVNIVFPYECNLADIAELARGQVNIVMYKEYGHTLAETLGQPYLHAPMGIQGTTNFIKELGELLGTSEKAEAFIQSEKKTTLQAVWDLWRGPQSDWFSTLTVGIVATRTYAEGLEDYLRNELGMLVDFVAKRPAKVGEMGNEEVRQAIHAKAPSIIYGSINERIYMSEAGATRSTFMPASFPGAAVRRAVGTPYMGYRGTVYIIQEIVNSLYDTLFHVLPVDSAYAQSRSGAPTGMPQGAVTAQPGNIPWSDEAKELLDKHLEHMPYIGRISASREYQLAVEGAARQQGAEEVTLSIAEMVLAGNRE